MEQARRELHKDLLKGASQIAEYVYGDAELRRRIYHLVETSNFPCFRLGSVVCARRSTIDAWIEEQERRGWRPKDPSKH
jgi:hypothetical protein